METVWPSLRHSCRSELHKFPLSSVLEVVDYTFFSPKYFQVSIQRIAYDRIVCFSFGEVVTGSQKINISNYF